MTTQNCLTRFSCNKDDGFWKVLAEISAFNVNSCFVCLL